MPIIDLQRRLREAGRIRIGEQVPVTKKDGSPGTAPKKLETFRLTSPDERSIRAAASLFGGEAQKWDGAPVGVQWELYTESTALDVIVPPVDLAFTQWMELWSGGGCQRRCDGQTNVIDDSICACDPDAPDCKPTTRLGVILADLEGIGIWRLETHGWNGAQELLGTIEVLRTIQARGAMVPARLLLEQRQSKKDGKTHNFAVPVLDLNLSVAALTGGTERPRLSAVSAVTPIPTEAQALATVKEQLHAVEVVEPRAPRSNAATPLPPTGLAPRPASAVVDPPSSAEPPAAARSTKEKTPDAASPGQIKRLFALMNGSKIVTKEREERLKWATKALDREITTFDDITWREVKVLYDILEGNTEAAVTAPTDYDDEEPF